MTNSELITMAKLLQQGDYHQLLSIQLDTSDDWAMLQSKLIHAMAYEKILHFHEAINCYAYALEHGDQSPFSRYTINLSIALCHKSCGNTVSAREHLLKSLEAASQDIRIDPKRARFELSSI